jgi:hypothetical protein
MSTTPYAPSPSRWRRFRHSKTSKVAAVGMAALAMGVAVTQHIASAATTPTAEWGPDYIKVRSQDFKYDDGNMSGWLEIVMWQSGNYNLHWHAHNGNKTMREYSIACTVESSIGAVHPFSVKGDLGGTSKLSFRGGDKTDDVARAGSSPDIRDDWGNLRTSIWANCRMKSSYDAGGLLNDLFEAGDYVEKGAKIYVAIAALAA